MSVQRGFSDLDARSAALSAAGDPLEKLNALIDFEIFRPALDAALQRSDGSKGGRPPLDAVMMFKTLILQTLYGLSDAQTEFQILDRRSFGRFLGLDDGDNTPDEKTIWRFREALVRANAIEALFARFDAHLKDLGYLAMGADRRRQHHRRPAPAHDRRGARPGQGWRDPGRLGRQASQAGAKGSRRALDAQAGATEEGS